MSESFPPQENERKKNHVKSWTEANQAQDWFLKTFFSMPRPRRDGSALTDFALKCFIFMALNSLKSRVFLWLLVLTKTLFRWRLLMKMTLNNILIKMKKSAKQLNYFS